MSFPKTLDPDRLYMFVFGPGKGESIVLRVPPAHWIVIDSCKVLKKAAARHVLDQYNKGEFSCLVLTHPHWDHYRHFTELLTMGDWSHVGCLDIHLDDAVVNPIKARANELEQIMAEIRRIGKRDPDPRWSTYRTTKRQIGDGELLCLHPEEAFVRANPNTDVNGLSSAMLFTWNAVKLVLGADVVHPHWQAIVEQFHAMALQEHTVLKVSHHASENGVFPGLLTGTGQRFWIATPYNSSHIPNFANGHGPDVLLQNQNEFHLTGLPVAHVEQQAWPCEATRAELLAGKSPKRIDFVLSKDLTGTALPKPSATEPSCYTIVSADASGAWRFDGFGPGSVRVKR